jgi:hypothetical protein
MSKESDINENDEQEFTRVRNIILRAKTVELFAMNQFGRLLAHLSICFLLGVGTLASAGLAVAAARSTRPMGTQRGSSSQFESDYLLYLKNDTGTSPAKPGTLPIMAPISNATGPVPDTGISSQPYVGVEGFQSHNSWQALNKVFTYVQLAGGASSIGSSIVSGGLSIHVPDGTYSVDYLLQLYAYFQSDGTAGISYGIYSACAGYPYACGPAYNCPNGICPLASVTIASGSVSSIGHVGDNIGLQIRWDNTYGYVFDYQDTVNNPYWWTVETLYPSGTYSTMIGNRMLLGDEYIYPRNDPVYYSYYFQVGVTMNSVPQNAQWTMWVTNTQYLSTTSSTLNFVDHATTLVWGCYQICPSYVPYWKERWTVSDVAAQEYGVAISGSGSSSSNTLDIYYAGGSQSGGVQLW